MELLVDEPRERRLCHSERSEESFQETLSFTQSDTLQGDIVVVVVSSYTPAGRCHRALADGPALASWRSVSPVR